ncbi:MAG: NAD(P)/FAD-dependent oxidoreductase [Solirubrobacteraceae bacterium]|nr:NAD(P)/FAD-dependent oxidoreductase [Solirubrobacteraceae bacterium]
MPSTPESPVQITPERPVVVLGGGPAGLTAGYLLAKAGKPVVVLEADSQVGGIAKTVVDEEGYRFDLGGHRFFTKVKEVDDLWHEVMGDEFLRRPRQSRIYWNGKFLEYPLEGMDVIRKLGPVELTRAGASYLRAQLRRKGNEESLEEWVSNRFGWRLYQLFFKTYTEKVWGVPCSELRAEWAAQRIRGLSFFSAAKAAFFGNKGNRIKSLISEFNYPRYGPGQMWDAMTQRIRDRGGRVLLESPVTSLRIEDGEVKEVVAGGVTYTPSAVISSLALRDTVKLARPDRSEAVDRAAASLRYRDFMTIALVVEGDDLFPDNWIYIHDPGVRVGRIQNFRSWSPWMVPDPSTASVGMEYFCFAGDDLWTTDDEQLVEMAKRELGRLRLGDPAKVRRGTVVRVPMAYPMYDRDYAAHVETIKGWLAGIRNLQQVGRNGLHRYNNSDHSMLTAMRAVDNLLLGTDHDLWAVNAESVYHEEDHEADPNPYPYRSDFVPPAPEQAVSES